MQLVQQLQRGHLYVSKIGKLPSIAGSALLADCSLVSAGAGQLLKASASMYSVNMRRRTGRLYMHMYKYPDLLPSLPQAEQSVSLIWLALRGKLHLSGSQNEGNAQHESDTRGPHGPLLTKGVVTPQDGGGHEPVLFSAGEQGPPSPLGSQGNSGSHGAPGHEGNPGMRGPLGTPAAPGSLGMSAGSPRTTWTIQSPGSTRSSRSLRRGNPMVTKASLGPLEHLAIADSLVREKIPSCFICFW
eukprot:Em0001g2022a